MISVTEILKKHKMLIRFLTSKNSVISLECDYQSVEENLIKLSNYFMPEDLPISATVRHNELSGPLVFCPYTYTIDEQMPETGMSWEEFIQMICLEKDLCVGYYMVFKGGVQGHYPSNWFDFVFGDERIPNYTVVEPEPLPVQGCSKHEDNVSTANSNSMERLANELSRQLSDFPIDSQHMSLFNKDLALNYSGEIVCTTLEQSKLVKGSSFGISGGNSFEQRRTSATTVRTSSNGSFVSTATSRSIIRLSKEFKSLSIDESNVESLETPPDVNNNIISEAGTNKYVEETSRLEDINVANASGDQVEQILRLPAIQEEAEINNGGYECKMFLDKICRLSRQSITAAELSALKKSFTKNDDFVTAIMPEAAEVLIKKCNLLDFGETCLQWYEMMYLQGNKLDKLSNEDQHDFQNVHPRILSFLYRLVVDPLGEMECKLCDDEGHIGKYCIYFPNAASRQRKLMEESRCPGCMNVRCPINYQSAHNPIQLPRHLLCKACNKSPTHCVESCLNLSEWRNIRHVMNKLFAAYNATRGWKAADYEALIQDVVGFLSA